MEFVQQSPPRDPSTDGSTGEQPRTETIHREVWTLCSTHCYRIITTRLGRFRPYWSSSHNLSDFAGNVGGGRADIEKLGLMCFNSKPSSWLANQHSTATYTRRPLVRPNSMTASFTSRALWALKGPSLGLLFFYLNSNRCLNRKKYILFRFFVPLLY